MRTGTCLGEVTLEHCMSVGGLKSARPLIPIAHNSRLGFRWILRVEPVTKVWAE